MFLVILCLLGQGALSYEHHIHSTSDLIAFSNEVNSGTSYNGTTVFLDADIDFFNLSERFEPIGNSESNYFQGTFDGQGHMISNLAMNSSSQHVGLFGYSKGATIRNVMLDSSCSFMGSYCGSGRSYVGIISYCEGCIIENVLNMGSVSFTGSTSRLAIGGIVGQLEATGTVRSCANYGSVTHSGEANNYANIGGIIGWAGGSSTKKIHNCLNYGTITHSGTTNNLYLGGILGCAYDTNYLENCVSGGKISVTKSVSGSSYIGSVVGEIHSGTTTVKHCYWTSDVGYNDVYGYKDSSVIVSIDTETSQVTLNTETINNLNNYAVSNSWNKWLLNTNNKPVTFRVNNGKGLFISSQLILLPSLAESENHTFSGWFEDDQCSTTFTDTSITNSKTLYGGWRYTVTFNGNGGTVDSQSTKSVVYGQKYGTLPTPTREGYAFDGWYTKTAGGTQITAESKVTLKVITPSIHTGLSHTSTLLKTSFNFQKM